MTDKYEVFGAYDIRGRVPEELNEDICYRIGFATAIFLKAKTFVVGHDIRYSSEALSEAVIKGLIDAGVEVLDVGLCGSEIVYFASKFLNVDGGIMITGSHNAIQFNGLKLVRKDARPIASESGLQEIKALTESDEQHKIFGGKLTKINIYDDYIAHILSFIDLNKLKPLKLVLNAGNGCGGVVSKILEKMLPFEIINMQSKPDSKFPNGIPNPMLKKNQISTSTAVVENKADMGIAWDVDFDRCFFFDEKGQFVEGYYIVGLLTQFFLNRNPDSKIVFDSRLFWNTQDLSDQNGGKSIRSKSGHSFFKEKMREVDAVYGGEMSSHHYFRDFFYADSGMIPWLIVAELISQTGKSLSQLISQRKEKFPVSGEINCRVNDIDLTIKSIFENYSNYAINIDDKDGYSFEFEDWRFNVRRSNTELLIRLNIESRGDAKLIKRKAREILQFIENLS